jgi:hypothetical protein
VRRLSEEWLGSLKIPCRISIVVFVSGPRLLVQCVEVVIQESIIELVVDMWQPSMGLLLRQFRVTTTS